MSDLPDYIVSASSGRTPIVRPKDPNIPNPSLPEWKELTFIRNAYGRVVDVPRWRAAEMIQAHEATLSNRAEYDQYLAQYTEWTAANPEKKYQDFQTEVLLPLLNKTSQPEEPTPVSPPEATPISNEVIEALAGTNEKIDKLTDAIIQLVQNQAKPEVAKPKGRPKKGSKNG